MSFNNGFERKQFNREQKRLAKKYRRVGMSETDIQAMHEYDLEVFRQYRRDREHAADPSDMMTNDESTGDSRYMDMDEFPADAPLVKYGNRYSWIDEINNLELHKAIVAMKPDYIEIITLMMEGYQQNDITKIIGIASSTLNEKIMRIREKLKKFSSTPNF